MSARVVTRHAGLVEWLRRRGILLPVEEHLDIATVAPGDVLVGVLPPHVAAQACRRGARVIQIAMDVPPQARGRQDHGPEEMDAWGARLEEIIIETRPVPDGLLAELRASGRGAGGPVPAADQASGRNKPSP